MTDHTGNIIRHTEIDRLGVQRCAYSWEGGPMGCLSPRDLPKKMRSRRMKPGDAITLGDLRLRVVAECDWTRWQNSVIVAPDGTHAWYYLVRFRLARWHLWWMERIVLTLAVWGQADYRVLPHWGTCIYAPGWGDVYLVKWIRKQWARVRRKE